jgi:hypothetical protein
MYVENILSGCFKNRLGCCTTPMADGQRPATAACRCCWGVAMGQPMWMSPCGHGVRREAAGRTRALALRGMRTRGVGRDANVSFPVLSFPCLARPDVTSHADVQTLCLQLKKKKSWPEANYSRENCILISVQTPKNSKMVTLLGRKSSHRHIVGHSGGG